MKYSISVYCFKLLLLLTTLCFGGTTLPKENRKISYIPRATLFAPPEIMAIKISPDTKFLAFVKGDPTGIMDLHLCATELFGGRF